MLPLLNISKLFLPAIFTLSASSSWIKTLKLGMMRQAFYHCATIAKHLIKLFYLPFSVSIHVTAVAGFEPLNLG